MEGWQLCGCGYVTDVTKLQYCWQCLTRPTALVGPASAAPPGTVDRTKFTIYCRFFSKNDSALTMLFNSFIKILAAEILPP